MRRSHHCKAMTGASEIPYLLTRLEEHHAFPPTSRGQGVMVQGGGVIGVRRTKAGF